MDRFSTGRDEAGDMTTNEVSRRGFMAAAGVATSAAATGAAAAQESPTGTSTGTGSTPAGNGTAAEGNATDGGGGGGGGSGRTVPVFGSYLSDANLYEQAATVDAREQDSITVSVGAGDGLAFDPPTVWVSPGTTITWEWTGEGGTHNVVAESGPAGLDSGSPVDSSSATYEYEVTEEDAGITTYKCVPHETQGMKGGVAVGDDVETTTIETGGDAGPSITIPDQALALTLATFIAMTTTLALGYFFMKYSGGNAENVQ